MTQLPDSVRQRIEDEADANNHMVFFATVATRDASVRGYIAGATREAERAMNLVEALRDGINCPRELCAQMSEGEEPNVDVYRTMANSAMKLIDEAISAYMKEEG